MTALAFLEVAAPVLLVTLLLIAGLFLLTRLVESGQDAQHWQRIVATLRCPACGSTYDSWDGATWGIDADPLDSARHDHGILLHCPHCRVAAYVVEQAESFRVYTKLDEATGAAEASEEGGM